MPIALVLGDGELSSVRNQLTSLLSQLRTSDGSAQRVGEAEAPGPDYGAYHSAALRFRHECTTAVRHITTLAELLEELVEAVEIQLLIVEQGHEAVEGDTLARLHEIHQRFEQLEHVPLRPATVGQGGRQWAV